MEFQIQGKPVVVTKDEPSQSIHHGWIADDPMRPGQLLLCATNSYTFVRIPIGAPPEGDEHAKGIVPREALAFSATHPDLPFKVAERHITVGSDVSFRRPTEGYAFPDLSRMLPDEPTNPMRVGIDTQLLSELAEAMGSDRVELIFDLDQASDGEGVKLYNKAILVRRASGDSKGQQVVPDGIIMPVRVEGGAPPAASPPAPEEPAAPPAEASPPPEQPPAEPPAPAPEAAPPAEEPPPPAEPSEHPPPPQS